ncbi:hypothetical protein ATKI12_8157 [Kitasatospora sp. Ki12]|uniref:acyl-CoA carboxylase epsilon subunit n=1 Tax=Kitasatospora xanthocidica TaxID=83382 RepID=UPI001675E47D|nr:acyl-CoA carboxylase epsilon subunit [Kitasatospora xanthocidica]GHF89261.1 hypothetical protein GCM10018790_78230 [Kitasatospora xanthocidica]
MTGEPLLRVLAGRPTAEELAVVTAVVLGRRRPVPPVPRAAPPTAWAREGYAPPRGWRGSAGR